MRSRCRRSATHVVLVSTVLLVSGACASNRTPERSFSTLAEATQGDGFEPGWLPAARVPASGKNIKARRDLGSNELWARFDFDDADRAGLPSECRRIGQQELRLPASQTRGIGWWPEMLRSDPAVAVQQFEVYACPEAGGTQPAHLALHRSLSTAFYWRSRAVPEP